MYEDDEEKYLTLTDDSGQEIDFEVIDEFPYKDKFYTVLLQFDDEDDEVTILEVIHGQENDYISINDDDILNEIFKEFQKRNKSRFDFK